MGFCLGFLAMFLLVIGSEKNTEYKMTCRLVDGHDFCDVKHADGFKTSFVRVKVKI